MNSERKIIVGISVGDLNGISGEIILKTFADERMLEFCTPVIFASEKVMIFLKKIHELNLSIKGINEIKQLDHKKINVFNVWNEPLDINLGEVKPIMGDYAIKSLRASVKALTQGEIDVLVTAPINKHNVQSETFAFPGHTNFLAQELNGESLMLMISDTLRVGLLTDHLPVKEVSEAITPELITKKINLLYETLKRDFQLINPKIAVLGINPHTGDQGVIGDEDDTVLRPTLKTLNDQGMHVYGPFAADSFFGSGNYKNFDAIMASYHDQGLIPFKTLAFGSGVNFTAGLSKIRTSPDHGTAYDIAPKKQADYSSFKAAVFAAIKIYKQRKEYENLSKNPLKIKPVKTFVKKRL